MTLAGGTALILAALLFVRYAAEPADDVAEDHLEHAEQFARTTPSPEPVAAAPALKDMPVASAGFAAPVVEEPPAAPAVRPRPKKAAPMPVAKPHVTASAKTAAIAKPAAPIAAVEKAPVRGDAAASNLRAASVSTELVQPGAVTLTGCLEISADGDDFRLTDTEGAEAPKSRSWRTGFLKKRATPVQLVEPPDRRGLVKEVGKRVAATGQLVDRDLRVSSVRVVGSSCE